MTFFVKLRRSYFWQFLSPIVRLFMKEVGKAALKAALGYVQQAANDSGLSNEEKREWVAGKLRNDFGDDMKDSMLNLAIEFAVAKAKGGKA